MLLSSSSHTMSIEIINKRTPRQYLCLLRLPILHKLDALIFFPES